MPNDEDTQELPVLEDKTIIESIDKASLTPMYDTNHEHKFVKDSEEAPDYYAEVCSVDNCNVGRLVRK